MEEKERGGEEFRRRQGDHSHIPENPLREHVGHDRLWVGGISYEQSNRRRTWHDNGPSKAVGNVKSTSITATIWSLDVHDDRRVKEGFLRGDRFFIEKFVYLDYYSWAFFNQVVRLDYSLFLLKISSQLKIYRSQEQGFKLSSFILHLSLIFICRIIVYIYVRSRINFEKFSKTKKLLETFIKFYEQKLKINRLIQDRETTKVERTIKTTASG